MFAAFWRHICVFDWRKSLNYVAHIHLAHESQTSLLGNFMGDFVKGKAFTELPDRLREGVQLHRKIDSFTDKHPIVLNLKSQFPDRLRRMSGVVLDIYFDHLLCKNWQIYSDHALADVLERFYSELAQSDTELPGRYARVKQGLLEHRWLTSYLNKENCLDIFNSIESRLSRPVSFAQDSFDYLMTHQGIIEEQFLTFYPELINYSKTHPISK